MDEYLLKSRLEDAARASGKSTKYLGFLDPAESLYAKNYFKNRRDVSVNFWGGFDDAERVLMAVGDLCDINEYFPISALNIKFREEDVLNHRDFLGSFIALGLERSCIGDILVENGRAVFFVKSEIIDYFLHSIKKIGKVGVKISEDIVYPLPNSHTFKELRGVVASVRLDCVVAFLIKTSREKARNLILSGVVNVNYNQVNSSSYKLNEGDKIAVRGSGKFVFDEITAITKKDRLSISCRKYI